MSEVSDGACVPIPGPRDPGSECVYRWAGPPSVELWRGPVVTDAGSYTGHSLITAGGRGGVVLLALRGDEVLLLRSTRAAAGAVMWELPRGFADQSGEASISGVRDALRELREETGLIGRDARDIGGYVTDSSIMPSRVRVVVCRVDGDPCGVADGEVEATWWVPVNELGQLVRSRVLADGHSLAALSVAGAWGWPDEE